ncbi:uncharacterized protein LOC143022637 [Oratosquilla oratoria]|uniref:uncharacterized protein LOC143022637 n=1 Tax=Oratosquilla oratoria TaxID=337810 RepID=UPI003F75BB88
MARPRLQRDSVIQKEKLERKLANLCESSEWNRVGREELIVNLYNRILTATEKQALSLGLKFDIGFQKKDFTEYVESNYRWGDSDIEKGFKQGVITCFHALARSNQCTIPKRYRLALEELGKDDNLIITSADKGGGVVVMNKKDYNDKMLDLLSDTTTYERKYQGHAAMEGENFKKEARKILSKTQRGKKLIGLLEEAPRPPCMRGLPKTHKPNIPMRPITSGIRSAPHRLAKCLAKLLSNRLGLISSAHLKNSSDLIHKLKDMDISGKKYGFV